MAELPRLVAAGLLCVAIAAAPVSAQQVPDNAHRTSYGKGWACNTAYAERDSGCVHLTVATDR